MVVGQDDVPIKDEFDDMQNSFADIGMDDIRDWNSDIMEYDYVDPDNNVTHVKMDSCVVFGQQNIPTANAWN